MKSTFNLVINANDLETNCVNNLQNIYDKIF